ncbi:hypothetical protein RN001_005681 [Aquatica leii]|uniref:Glucose-methanol-choline oxidoreductase N-terminal domain-containing protein n=1 Tax=Aquatica leii TaxID=1421715 RepID=A0AAN7SHZ5_9COLE|nr:hypothetical protein RN001_005681 [Aquatica leii]
MKQVRKDAKVEKAKMNLFQDSSDSDVPVNELCDDSSDISEEFEIETVNEIEINDFVIVRYLLKKRIKYYVGQVVRSEDSEYFVNFLKRSSRGNKFVFPEIKDEDLISKDNIVAKLPLPFTTGGTERAAKQWSFDYDFSLYNQRAVTPEAMLDKSFPPEDIVDILKIPLQISKPTLTKKHSGIITSAPMKDILEKKKKERVKGPCARSQFSSNIFESVREVFVDENLYQRSFDIEPVYDFIIVGAGSAGSVLANRLSENPNWKILVLEAGIEENYFTDIPLLAPFQSFTRFNWNFESEKSNKSCLSLKNNRCNIPRGKIVGGTSVLNFLIYTRGNKLDYDEWEKLGNKGWSYADLLPYFKKSENCSLAIQKKIGADKQYRGTDGPLNVDYAPFETPISDLFLKTGNEFGLPITDPNGKFHRGFSKAQATMINGKRCSAAKAYLKPIKERKNLFILTEATVTKILIDPNKKQAFGIEFMKNGTTYKVQSEKEVILSAGSINSPQLLMLSGIGPQEDLERLKIPVIVNLKVGFNLQDHCALLQTFLINETVTISDLSVQHPMHVFNYWFNKKGPLTLPGGAEAIAFMNTNLSVSNIPDVELVLGAGGFNNDLLGSLRYVYNFPNKLFFDIFRSVLLLPSFSITTILMKPKSKGQVKLRSSNPLKPPLLYLNYLDDESDVNVLLEGLKLTKMVGESKYLKKYDAKLHKFTIPACKHLQQETDKHLICLIRNLASSLGHQVGTCKMGPSTDPDAVVDPELKVYGVKGLRVIDGSIMPNIIAGHTNSVIMMIAEKGSDLIKSAWTKK